MSADRARPSSRILYSEQSAAEALVRQLKSRTKFSEEEILEIHQKFRSMVRLEQGIDRENFYELIFFSQDEVGLVSNRIFRTIDSDGNGVISFEEYILFFNTLIHGSVRDKAMISFRIIDTENRGQFGLPEVVQLVAEMLESKRKASLQESHDLSVRERAIILAESFYYTVDSRREGAVDFDAFYQAITRDKSLLDFFSMILNGMSDGFIYKNIERLRLETFINRLQDIQRDVLKVKRCVGRLLEEAPELVTPKKAEEDALFASTLLIGLKGFQNKKVFAVKPTQPAQQLDDFDGTGYSIGRNPSFMGSAASNPQQPGNQFASPPTVLAFSTVQNLEAELQDQVPALDSKNRFHDNMLRVPKLNSIVHKELDRYEVNEEQQSVDKSTLVALDLQNTLDLIEKKIENFKEGLLNSQDKIKGEVEKKALSFVKKNMGTSIREFKPENNKLLFILHENWSLMASMMMGIQKSVLSLANEPETLSSKDFNLQYTFELRPAQVSAKDAEVDSYKKSIFYDYAPHVFSEIRRLFGISSKAYLSSLGTESVLNSLLKGELSSFNELVSSGKSGSFFYYSANGKFILKTISKEEFSVLQEVLPRYFEHLRSHPNTLMCRFYGLHKIVFKKLKGAESKSSKIYFVIMNNLFDTNREIDVRYDLKGSLYKRETASQDRQVAKKDLDFLRDGLKIELDDPQLSELKTQIALDSAFFAENGLLDYSMLLGVYRRKRVGLSPNLQEDPEAERKHSRLVYVSPDKQTIYYIVIIDFLTSYSWFKKKVEYYFKSNCVSKEVSCVPPKQYAKRFKDFLVKAVVKADDQIGHEPPKTAFGRGDTNHSEDRRQPPLFNSVPEEKQS